MIPNLRRAFNATFTPAGYEAYKARLTEAAGCRIGFRVCETPVFLPPALRDRMVEGALEIWDQLLRPEGRKTGDSQRRKPIREPTASASRVL